MAKTEFRFSIFGLFHRLCRGVRGDGGVWRPTSIFFFKCIFVQEGSSGTRFDHGQFEIKTFPIYAPPYFPCNGAWRHSTNSTTECIILTLQPPGGHSHWKGVWGCAMVMTPFFQVSCRSLASQFTINAPLLWIPFSIFRKFLDFQPCFGQNSSSLDPNFSKFSFSRPPFYKKNQLPRPYILKPAWRTSTKKSWVPPPPGATTGGSTPK